MSEIDPTPQQNQGAPANERPHIAEPVTAQGSYVPPPPPAAPASAPKKRRSGLFAFGLFTGCLVLLAGIFFTIIAFSISSVEGSSRFTLGQKVAVVPVEGPILEARDIVDALEEYGEDSNVKAIVLRINSPGGGIAPSQEIYAQIKRVRDEGTPVVASLDSVAASGGYYIAAACDQIVANPGSITGSIGVILQWLEYEELVKWAKMRPETITSGALKAAGSPFQRLSETERAYLQNVVNQLHSQFVRAVAEGRKGKLNEAEVTGLADGRVFTGEEALRLKLVDKLGTLHDAVDVAGELGGIDGEPAMIYPKPRPDSLIDLLTADADARTLIDKMTGRRAAQFLYLWEAAGAASVK